MSAGILLEKKPEKRSDIYQYDAPVYPSPKETVWQLGIGRIFAILLLMTASWYWLGDQLPDSYDAFARPPLLIFAIWLFLGVVYLAALNIRKYRLRQVTVQLITDATMITWLVWATGDVRSPYITLYTVIICLVSVFFVSRVTLTAAIVITVVFTSLMLLVMFGVVPRVEWDGGTVSAWRAMQIIAFHDVAFLVVGLLASQLAVRQRRSTLQLEETVQSLSNLQRLHERIVQSIRSGLVTTDLDGKIYTFNAAAEEITGHQSAEVRGWTIFDLLGDIQRPISETMMALDRSEQTPRLELDFSKPDGGHVRLGWSVSPLFDETGTTTGLIITFQDLTDIRLMEESVRRKDRLAAVGRVAAGLAHEIRNPLGAMRGAIQVLQAGMDKESSQAQLMDIVLRESDRLNAIITNFLGYARPRNGEFTEVDLRDVIHDAMALLRHSPDIRKFHQIVEEMPEKPLSAVVDAAGLKQVFWNLTRNAVQAMPNGGTLTVTLEELPHNHAQITFADTGKGMPQQQVDRLFEPFSQSTTGGTGLGLSIVYQIIRDHNGAIHVTSIEGKGTTITIGLPTGKEVNPEGVKG